MRRRFSWSRLRRERGGGEEEEGGEGFLFRDTPLSKITDSLAFATPLSNELLRLHCCLAGWYRKKCQSENWGKGDFALALVYKKIGTWT